MRSAWLAAALVALSAVVAAFAAAAATAAEGGARYAVGPTREYKTLQEVAEKLEPGDVVEVDGGATYPGDVKFTKSGTAEKPITIRGIRVEGKRPIVSGGDRTVAFMMSNYMVFEAFEIEKGARNGMYNRAASTVIRDTLVRDCPQQGIMASDTNSGSLTLDHVEVANCGGGTQTHPIYVSTDPHTFPGAVFRMQYCYIHDAKGGNAVKSRCERNEIYYNCFEAGFYRELEMIGRDSEQSPRPMNSDVVGNIFIKTSAHPVVRAGSDSVDYGSRGRYRFVDNTFILGPQGKVAIQTYGFIESLEISNNIFYREGGAAIDLIVDEKAQWTTGKRVVAGQNNWIIDSSIAPPEWTGTLGGLDPGFVAPDKGNYAIAKGSPCVDAGTMTPKAAEGFEFPNPLFPPAFEPPLSQIWAIDVVKPRAVEGTIDIGAYEYNGGKQTIAVSSDTH